MLEFLPFLEKHCKQCIAEQSTSRKRYLPTAMKKLEQEVREVTGDACM
jgi:hypothetical protein